MGNTGGETEGAEEREERDRESVGSLDGGLTELTEVDAFLEIGFLRAGRAASREFLSGSFD